MTTIIQLFTDRISYVNW